MMRLFRTSLFFVTLFLLFGTEAPTAQSACSVSPLPAKELRTDEFWKGYLKENLVQCYGRLHPHVMLAIVVIQDDWLSTHECLMTCAVVVSRRFLDNVEEPSEILFVLGHEAGHLAFFGKYFRTVGSEDSEHAADLIAVEAIPSGACHGVRVLEWVSVQATNSQMDEVRKNLTLEELKQRRTLLSTKCTVDYALEKL